MVSASTAKPSLRFDRGSDDDVTLLFSRWQRQRDPAAHEALVRRFMPLTRSLARRYDRSSEPFEDLLQVASVGLLKALDRFEADRGHSFPSFAVPTILGEMRRYFRDCGWSVHVPRGDQERALKVRNAQETLTNERGHAPDGQPARRIPGAGSRAGDRRPAGDRGVRNDVARRSPPGRRRRQFELRRVDRPRGRALRAGRVGRHHRRGLGACARARARDAAHALRRGV